MSKARFCRRILATGETKGEFRTRLAIEGRWNEFVSVREKLKAEDGLSGGAAWVAASGQFFALDGQEDQRDAGVIVGLVRSELKAAKESVPTAEVTA